MKGPDTEIVEKMFDSIATDYDKLNHLLSLDIDKTWRKRALKQIVNRDDDQEILDLACGTGDFSIDIAQHSHPDTKITGLDLSEGMLEVMKDKVHRMGLDDRIITYQGNCEKMSFSSDSFDRVTIGFGIRNFENREQALSEILRVLKPGGRMVIIELSVPEIPVIKQLYKFYFLNILPWVGGKISGERAAYNYLPSSVLKFPPKREWMSTMSAFGFRNVSHKAFTFGICRMHIGEK